MNGRLTGPAWVAAALVVLASLAPAIAEAAAGPWAVTEQARLRLVSAQNAVPEDGRLSLGLQFQLEPGWKIYWRSPGDAGFPPNLDWSGSENLASPEMLWPIPKRFSLFGLETFGYGKEVVLPIEAQSEAPGRPVRLAATVDFLVCEEICIPYQEPVSLELPSGAPTTSAHAVLINSFRALVPGHGADPGLTIESVALTGSLDAPVIEALARSETAFTAPDLLVEGPAAFSYARPEVALASDGREALIRVPVLVRANAQTVIEGKRLTLTLTDGRRGLEEEVIARFAKAPEAAGVGLSALLAILGVALLGGLILNVMPCLLPVLSIKLLSVVGQGGKTRAAVRRGFLASAAGIVASFLVLAVLALGLKSAGLAVGWGIQFQQPAFLVAMTLVLVLFACNLFGLFEFALPSRLGDTAATARSDGLTGHFLTGAFATLLATPCSAPFLGTAIGFALARGAGEIIAVFAALGVGMAIPYLTVAAVPGLATRLPRPGGWMVRVKQVLALALIGTAIWLVSVLSVQAGPAAAIGIALASLAIIAVLWVRHRAQTVGRRRLAAGLVAGLAVAAFAALGVPATDGPKENAAADRWERLDVARIADLVAEDKVVFVDVTAEWCLTCQVNKSVVLDREAVADRLAGSEIITMRGDWTLPDDEISHYLESFGRYGIPFNAVYGPGLPDGKALPELLSVDAVMAAIDEAAGS